MPDSPKESNEVLRPEQLFRTLAEIRRTAKPLEPLWGFLLYKKAITSIIGDPGVCKTTLGYGWSISLCEGKEFLGIMPEEQVVALYMDFESSDSLIMSRANLLEAPNHPNFYVYNIVDYYLNQLSEVTIKWCREKGVNLILVDNQSMAFNTRDENDNAEAIKQMKYIRAFTNAINCATVIFHHTSKANAAGTRKGSGAFARARLADICINLDIPDETDKDIVRFEVVKNRLIDEKVVWYLKKDQGRFTFTEPPIGAFGIPTNTKLYAAQQAILDNVNGEQEYKHSELMATLTALGIEEPSINSGLLRLVQQGRLVRPRYGYYARKVIEL